MLQRIEKFFRRDSQKGQGIVEYALILAFVAAIAAYVFTSSGQGSIKDSITGLFDKAKTDIGSAKDGIQGNTNNSGGGTSNTGGGTGTNQ